MKVADLRKQIKETDPQLVNRAFVELYKLLPKKSKEELADPMIHDIFAGKSASAASVKKKNKEPFDLDAFMRQSQEMLDYAYDGYYYFKNNTVSSRKQGAWRFEIKRIIKTIDSFGPDTPEYTDMQDLLYDVYKLMSHACWYKTFHSDNIFDSIGIGQRNLFDKVVTGQLDISRGPEDLMLMAELAVTGGVHFTVSYSDLADVFRSHLIDDEEREVILDWVKTYTDAEKDAYDHALINMMQPIEDWKSTHMGNCNNAVALGFEVCFDMKQEQRGIDLFSERYLAPDPETKLCALLGHISTSQSPARKKWWIKAYEDAVAEGVKPRDWLQDDYKRYTKEQ